MKTIGGTLDMAALAALSGSQDGDGARMRHFHCLDRARQAEAIRRLQAAGHSVHGISAATRLSVEVITRVLEASDDAPMRGACP
jgi:hypothetical protein